MAHVLINGCRQRRAVQLALQSLRIAVSCDGLAQLPDVPPTAHRFWTTAVPPAAATAAPEAGGTPTPSKRRFKYNHDEIFESAERLFETTLGADHAEVAATDGVNSPNGAITAEMIDEFNATIAIIDRKRARRPVKRTGETLESWRERNDYALQPFLAFLARHHAELDRTVALLFTGGERGRRLMLGQPSTPAATDGEDAESSVTPPYERAFAAWEAALAVEGVPLSAEDMLQRWPSMLVRTPASMPTTLAVLRAALPDADAAVAAAPSLLAALPLNMQGRLVQLHLAAEGELPTMLAAEPRLLTYPLPHILANMRVVRALSRSAREFRSFLYTDPSALCMRQGRLEAGVAAVTRALSRALPPEVDPSQVISAKPQLVLVRGSWLASRWRNLCAEAEAVEEWQRQLNSVVAAAAAAGGGEGRQEFAESDAADVSSMVPEWINAETDPKALGIPAPGEEGASTATDANGDDEDEETVSEVEQRSRKAYSALGEALLMKPWRLQRLQYIVESEGVEGAGQVSLIGALTVQLEQFLEKYPGFEEWRQQREAEEREARQQRRWERDQEYEAPAEEEDTPVS